jgi:outer membrane protein assembly factor BamA
VNCDALSTNAAECSAEQLLGSRVAIMNAELRFPLIRRFDLGVLPIALPPIDGLVFYDGGIAWNPGQSISFNRPANYDWSKNRYVLRSYGFGVRFNLLGFAILRYDWAKPLDRPGRKGFGTWSFGPSF